MSVGLKKWTEYSKVFAAIIIITFFSLGINDLAVHFEDRVLFWMKGVIKWQPAFSSAALLFEKPSEGSLCIDSVSNILSYGYKLQALCRVRSSAQGVRHSPRTFGPREVHLLLRMGSLGLLKNPLRAGCS